MESTRMPATTRRSRLRVSVVAGVSVSVLYFLAVWAFISELWQRKEAGGKFGDSAFDGTLHQLMLFPASTLGLSHSILVFPVLNSCFWGIVTFALVYVLGKKRDRTIETKGTG
jgi:hypothetical protein